MVETDITIAGAVERFLQDIGRGHSMATRNTYGVALKGYLHYLEQKLEQIPAVTPITALEADWAVAFLRYKADGLAASSSNIAQDKASKATLATYAAAISRFYKWCGIERLLTLPAEEYERMQVRFKELKGKERRTILSKVPSDEIVEALIAEARKVKIAQPQHQTPMNRVKQELIWLRDIAMLETLRCTGARVSELTNLTRGDLDATNHRARTIGKGDKERWLYFSTAAWEALEKYLAARTRALNVAVTEENTENPTSQPRAARRSTQSNRSYVKQPLFARHDRGAKLNNVLPLTPRSVQRMVIELVNRAELDSNITPHKFRHWVATHLLAATGDLAATQDLLGHASPTTTRIYAQVSEQTKQKLHKQVFN